MPESNLCSDFSIAVVGGGIGGLCLTLGLLRNGISVDVYERDASFSEISQGIAFGPNSIQAMHRVDPAIRKQFLKRATHNDSEASEGTGRTWINFRNGIGDNHKMITKVGTMDLDLTGLSSVSRATFLNDLAAQIPSEITHFNKRLRDVMQLASGNMLMIFDDGSTAQASAVVGADGIRSICRQRMFERSAAEEDLSFAGTIAYRALVPMHEAIEHLGTELATNATMYAGTAGHVLTYPIDHGESMNVVASINRSSWESDRWVHKNATYEQMRKDFVGWCEPVQQILKAMAPHKPDLWALFDSKPVPTFYQGHLALLGDSAHASLPHQGAGAGQAIEDAAVLSAVLADPSIRTAADIPNAFRAYDAIRRPRSQKVVSTSRVAGKVYKFEGEMGDDLAKIAVDALTRFHWIWYEDMDVQVERALAILQPLRN